MLHGALNSVHIGWTAGFQPVLAGTSRAVGCLAAYGATLVEVNQ
jgi:hypothetical protein